MNPIVCDTETTIFQNGNPFSECNKLVYVGIRNRLQSDQFPIEYGLSPYGSRLEHCNRIINQSDLFVAFNAKFDLHWLRRYGIHVTVPVWDLQLAEFIISGQASPLPALDSTCSRVGLGGKSGDIAARYWDKGIDTTEIPEAELIDYVRNDCEIEWQLFQWQMAYLEEHPELKRIIWDACQDEAFTAEMEWNGLLFDLDLCKELGEKYSAEIASFEDELDQLVPDAAGHWGSGDYVSAVLYGGTVFVDGKEEYIFHYKDGRMATKYRSVKIPVTFPRLVDPRKGTNLKKQGFFKTDEGTLKKLKTTGKAKRIIELILKRNKLDKKVGTYFFGIPKLYEEMQWQNHIIHGQLQHAVAKTGRLASSKPNQQNFDPELLKCIKTRFPNG